jgi:hypothetical protein
MLRQFFPGLCQFLGIAMCAAGLFLGCRRPALIHWRTRVAPRMARRRTGLPYTAKMHRLGCFTVGTCFFLFELTISCNTFANLVHFFPLLKNITTKRPNLLAYSHRSGPANFFSSCFLFEFLFLLLFVSDSITCKNNWLQCWTCLVTDFFFSSELEVVQAGVDGDNDSLVFGPSYPPLGHRP